jgi:type VI secretion system secreted protein VgrG
MLMDVLSMLSPQNKRLFKLNTFAQAGDEDLMLEHFSGTEGLSRLFQMDLALLSQRTNVKLKSLIGRPATVEIELADGSTRYINGYINRFSSRGSDGGIVRYSAVLGPWLWMLTCRFDSRIFQGKTVQDVVTEVFGQFGALPKFEFRLSKPLKQHSYITQYRESDFNFVQRLLESEGLFYYFEHTADSHLMIIADDSSTLMPLPEQPQIRFHSASVTETADAITQWSATRQLQSGKIAVRTFDYRQPRNFLPVTMQSINEQGDVDSFEIYDFPGQYTHGTYEDGEALVRNRVEALELLGKTFYGDSNCRAMKPGFTFELTQHYEHDLGSAENRQFLLISVEHSGSNNYMTGDQAGYLNKFVCVRKKIAYRPQLTTRKPSINGPQTAIIVGPPGEEIYTDELGRVKVQFHWDRYGEFNDKSSCWVRVAQSGASGGFGSILIPRVGDEVVVVFLDGNPDRPLIMGSLYNSQNTPPWSLPANKTQSGFLTRSMKGKGGNANFFRFEDKAGAEQVIVHAERNMDTEIEADESHKVGGNRQIKVEGKHSETIKLETSIAVEDGSYYVTVDKGEVKIKAATSITLEVGASKLVMNQDGTITLSGIVVDVEGKTIINLNK